MADEEVGLKVKVKVHGEQQLRRLQRQIKNLGDHHTVFANRINSTLNSVDNRWKKHFDQFDAMVKMMGTGLTKFVGASAKFATIQIGALGAAMMAVHGAFVLGNAAMKAFRYVAKGVAAGLASITVAAATAAAAIRENQAAMFAYKKLGKNEFGAGINQVRQEMRAMARDTDLAGLSAKDLNSIYSQISKTGVYTQSSQALVKGLMDFGAAGQSVEQGASAVGAMVALLQDPKASFSQITKSAKDLGPAMEEALKQMQSKGMDTVQELRAAILDGSLALAGGVNGQFATVNDTLIGRFKSTMNLIKGDFGDMGQTFLAPAKDALEQLRNIIRRTFVQVSGTITAFGKGTMLNSLVDIVDKLSRGFADMINNYVPKAEGMLKGVSDWWGRFKDGWNDVLDRVRPLIDAARVLENMFGNMLGPVFDQIGSAVDHTRNLILDNRSAFEDFGTRIGTFITSFGEFARTVREVFVQALPYINQIVDGATKLFDLFNGILRKAQSLTGGGAGGAFALATGLLAGGRAMKNTIGGVVPDYGKMQSMNVQATNVTVNGGAGGGMASKGGAGYSYTVPGGAGGMRSINGFPVAPAGLLGPTPTGMYGSPLPSSPINQQKGMRSARTGQVSTQSGTGATAGGGLKVQHPLGVAGLPMITTPQGRKLGVRDADWWRGMTAPSTTGYSQSVQGVDPSRYQKFMGKYGPRAQRTSAFYASLMGDKEKGIKGFNQSGKGMIGATLGLNLLSSIAPESAKGALSLGSMVGAFNPMAGFAVAGLGTAATSTSSGFGALGGAMGGAAAGAMVAGLPGAIAGALIGAVAGGIMGAINKRKEEVRLAKEAGRSMALNIQSGIMQGVSSAVAVSRGMNAGEARTTLEQNVLAIRDQNRAQVNAYSAYIGKSNDELRDLAASQMTSGIGPFATLDSAQRQRFAGDPTAFLNEAITTFETQANAAQTTYSVYEARMGEYTSQFGMDSNQIFQLARESGVNLMDATSDFTSSMNQLTSALINNTVELNAYIGEAWADIYDMAQQTIKAAEAPLIYDEAARTLYDKAQGGPLSQGAIAEFMSVAAQQFPAMYADNPTRGLIEFVRQFSENGLAFGTPGTPLYGMGPTFYNDENRQLMEDQTSRARTAISASSQQLLISALNTGGLQLMEPSVALDFGAKVAELSMTNPDLAAYTSETLAGFGDRFALAPDQDARDVIKAELQNFLSAPAFGDIFGNLATEAFKPSVDTIAAQASAVYDAIIDVFGEGFNVSAGLVDISSPTQTLIQATGTTTVQNIEATSDTKFPKSSSIGDTATNLAQTLGSHQRLDNMAGNRFITSSYRNFALGSPNSDHVNGRAYDLVGDNLISYRDAVKRDGGFAEFHGDRSTRHLHVVPRIGDSMLPAYTMATGIASAAGPQSDGGNTYNITVNGAGSNPEEIANMVIHKIKTTEKVNRERSY